MNVITPFIKVIDDVQLVLWDYSFRASMYESFLIMGDYGWYTPVKFEKL